MNQKNKRSRDRKRVQNLDGSVMNTGGHVVSHSRDAAPVVRTPQKATGDVPAENTKGIAKASPFFKKVAEVVKPKSKEEEKKAIAKATEKVIEKKTPEKKSVISQDRTQDVDGDESN